METQSHFSLPDAIALLARTPATLDSLLSGLPESWTHRNEGPNTWSARDILGHLLFVERTQWLQRIQFLLAEGEARPFNPVNRFAQLTEDRDKSLPQLLEAFAHSRSENLTTLRSLNLQPEDFARRGVHPAFGPVTLSELLATWTIHDLNHLHQLSRVMAHQYRDEVGPWQAYLGVLKCDGHSAA